MNKFLWAATAATALMAAPSVAFANDSGQALDYDAGWYVRGNVGYGGFENVDTFNAFNTGTVESEGNVAGSLGLGYKFGNNWRLELDGTSLSSDMGEIDSITGTSAKIRTTGALLNAIYDFDDFGKWTPYAGIGLGLVETSLKYVDPANCTGVCAIDDSETGLGWNILAGLGYDINDRLTWDTHYKYLNVEGERFQGVHTVAGVSGLSTVATDSIGAHMLMTGLTYSFGRRAAMTQNIVQTKIPAAKLVVEAPKPTISCWDNSLVFDRASCPVQPAPEPIPYVSCWDGTYAANEANCPAIPQQTYIAPTYNNCGPSNIAIFDVDLSAAPKQLSRLGTMPEFGDSHELDSYQFFEKLQAKYAANENGDRAYLNYLFKSMGYTNGFADASAGLFSEETLPVGTTGILGLGKAHHYAYHVLPTNDRDRQAFRIQSANGSVVHFMKTCGNYLYACN